MKKADLMDYLLRLIKPLMNQRGEVGDSAPAPLTITLDENGFIPGTTYKSMDEFVKGHGELKTRFDAQGNELGQVRGQAQILAESLKEALTKGDNKGGSGAPTPADGEKAAEYEAKVADLEGQLSKLDPMADDFTTKQAKLVKEISNLSALAQHEKTLAAAGDLFKSELNKRDTSAAQQKFLEQNPSFNTPEMQTRIKEFLSTDKTGMHDNMSAFFAIQAADAAQQAQTATTELEEARKLLELKKGEGKVGKVYTKGQAPGPTPAPTRLAGKDADAGAFDILNKVRNQS